MPARVRPCRCPKGGDFPHARTRCSSKELDPVKHFLDLSESSHDLIVFPVSRKLATECLLGGQVWMLPVREIHDDCQTSSRVLAPPVGSFANFCSLKSTSCMVKYPRGFDLPNQGDHRLNQKTAFRQRSLDAVGVGRRPDLPVLPPWQPRRVECKKPSIQDRRDHRRAGPKGRLFAAGAKKFRKRHWDRT
jgi:hypothetical protein